MIIQEHDHLFWSNNFLECEHQDLQNRETLSCYVGIPLLALATFHQDVINLKMLLNFNSMQRFLMYKRKVRLILTSCYIHYHVFLKN